MIQTCSAFGGKFTNCILIPQRYLLGIMVSFSTFCAYTLRVSLSLAITEMTVKDNTSGVNSTEYCGAAEGKFRSAVKNTDDVYDWSQNVQATLLASFYWSYVITHLPGALLAERIGGKHVLGFGMWLNGIVSLITPMVVIKTKGAPAFMIVLRVLMGVGQGMVYPVTTGLLGQWIPARDKSLMASVLFAGALLGTALTQAVGGVLIETRHHWDIMFYVFGVVTIVWCIAWQIFCYSFPRTHPCLKEKEREYLDKELTHVSKEKVRTPMKKILTSLHVWGYIIGQFGHDWGWYTMISDLPKYFSDVLRYNVTSNGLYASLPYVAMYMSGVFFGWLADFLIKKKMVRTITVRRIFGTLGQTVPGVFMVLAVYCGCHRGLAITCFSLSLFFMGLYYPGMKVNALDLAPNFAATVMACANGLGVFAGMLAPQVVGWVASNKTLSEWRIVFWITFGLLAGTNVFYIIFLSGDVQPWNNPEEEHEA